MNIGKLFFIVGPSGSGKDTLMMGVKPFLPPNEFAFARRVITRTVDINSEDHDSCSVAEFMEREKRGDFIITWQAHGLYYGLPSSILTAINQGVNIIANGSRNEIIALQQKVPSLCVIEITAPTDILRKRLTARNRETPEDIERRLERASLPLPDGVPVIRVKNDVTTEIGISRLKAALLKDADATDHLTHLLYQKITDSRLSKADYEVLLPVIMRDTFSLADVQAFLIACTEQLDLEEIISIAHARTLLYPRIQWPQPIVMDKHSLGGIIGNRVTMVVIPIIAAFGLLIPKTSSRAITSAAGTADTMEVLAKVDLTFDEVQACVCATNGCIAWNGKLNHSILDDAINQITRSFHLDTRYWSVASILSKKFTAGSTHIVIDIPYVSTGKVKTLEEATELAHLFETVGQAIGLVVKAFPTDGSIPVGCGVGPSLEVRDVFQVLNNDANAPKSIVDKALFFAAHLLAMDQRVGNFDAGYELAQELLLSGAALQSMNSIIEFQGKSNPIHPTIHCADITAQHDGVVTEVNGYIISGIARRAGAPSLKSAGVDLKKTIFDTVKTGEVLYRIHSSDPLLLEQAYQLANQQHGFILKSLNEEIHV